MRYEQQFEQCAALLAEQVRQYNQSKKWDAMELDNNGDYVDARVWRQITNENSDGQLSRFEVTLANNHVEEPNIYIAMIVGDEGDLTSTDAKTTIQDDINKAVEFAFEFLHTCDKQALPINCEPHINISFDETELNPEDLGLPSKIATPPRQVSPLAKLSVTEGNVTIHNGMMHFEDGTTLDLDELRSASVTLSDYRGDAALPNQLKGKTGTVTLTSAGDIEITSPTGCRSTVAFEMDAGIPRLHVFAPDESNPGQTESETCVTMAIMPGKAIVSHPTGTSFEMASDDATPTPTEYFDGDEILAQMDAADPEVELDASTSRPGILLKQ